MVALLSQSDWTVAKVLNAAAADRSRVSGFTHNFYRYPARFSPTFAAAAIHCFSKPGDVVMDPYMGGGTTIVEAMAQGRRVVGNDLNSLAVFVAKVKTTPAVGQGISSSENLGARSCSVPLVSFANRSTTWRGSAQQS